jgi:hypothetical protein
MHIAEQAEAHKLARAEGDGPVSNETARAYLNAFPADKTAEGIHALAIVRGLRERNRELEKLARIGELAIAAQKSTDYYCNESTIQPSEEDWRIDGTESTPIFLRPTLRPQNRANDPRSIVTDEPSLTFRALVCSTTHFSDWTARP